MNHVVGISEMKVSNLSEDVIITHSLGSCIGLTLYDPVVCVGGMVHCMLPLSTIDPAKAKETPLMFTDTGVVALIKAVLELGADKGHLIATVAGAAQPLERESMFRIGERNYVVLRKALWKNSILIAAEDVGGTSARTMCLHLDTGRIVIRSAGVENELWGPPK